MTDRAFSPLVTVHTTDEGSEEQKSFHAAMDLGQTASQYGSHEPASAVAMRVHAGQMRKGGQGVPYITHPAAVAGMLHGSGASQDVIDAGWLHDVLEDGGCEKDLAGFSDHTKNIVKSLSKPKGMDKLQYLQGLKTAHPDALTVKAADRIHNLHSGVDSNMGEGWMTKYLGHTKHLLDVFDAANHKHPLVEELRNLHAKLSKPTQP